MKIAEPLPKKSLLLWLSHRTAFIFLWLITESILEVCSLKLQKEIPNKSVLPGDVLVYDLATYFEANDKLIQIDIPSNVSTKNLLTFKEPLPLTLLAELNPDKTPENKLECPIMVVNSYKGFDTILGICNSSKLVAFQHSFYQTLVGPQDETVIKAPMVDLGDRTCFMAREYRGVSPGSYFALLCSPYDINNYSVVHVFVNLTTTQGLTIEVIDIYDIQLPQLYSTMVSPILRVSRDPNYPKETRFRLFILGNIEDEESPKVPLLILNLQLLALRVKYVDQLMCINLLSEKGLANKTIEDFSVEGATMILFYKDNTNEPNVPRFADCQVDGGSITCLRYRKLFGNKNLQGERSVMNLVLSGPKENSKLEVWAAWPCAEVVHIIGYGYPDMHPLGPSRSLSIKDMFIEIPDIRFTPRGLFLIGTAYKDQSLLNLVYWDANDHLVTNTFFPQTAVGGSYFRICPQELNIVHGYFFAMNNEGRSPLHYLSALRPELIVNCSNPELEKLPRDPDGFSRLWFEAQLIGEDATSSNWYSIGINLVENSPDKQTFALPAELRLFSGTDIFVPVSLEDFSLIAPTFEIETDMPSIKASIVYATKIPTNINDVLDTEELGEIMGSMIVGPNSYLLTSSKFMILVTCHLIENSRVSCVKRYKIENTNKILDAREYQSFLYMVQLVNDIKILIMRLSPNGQLLSQNAILGREGWATDCLIRGSNQTVTIIITLSSPEGVGTTLYSAEYYYNSPSFPNIFENSNPFPGKFCPISMLWSPKKEPVIFFLSKCENEDAIIYEFETDVGQLKNMRLRKGYATGGRKITFCPTVSTVVYLDSEKNHLVGVSRVIGEKSLLTYSIGDLKSTEGAKLICTRYNAFFQLLVPNPPRLYTYRTDNLLDIQKRVHSIIDLDIEPKFGFTNVNIYEQNVFTLIFGQNMFEAFFIQLDTPNIWVRARGLKHSMNKIKATVKARSKIYSSGPVFTSTTDFYIMEQQTGIQYNINDKRKEKIRTTHSIKLERVLKISGITINQSIQGISPNRTDVVFKPRQKFLDNEFDYLKDFNVVDLRIEGELTFAWTQDTVMICKNKRIQGMLFNIMIKSATALWGDYIHSDEMARGERSKVIYLTGLAKNLETKQTALFVLHQQGSRWIFTESQVADGMTNVTVTMIDPAAQKVLYVATDFDTDAITGGVYSLEYDKVVDQYYLSILATKTLKTFDYKLDNFQALFIRNMIMIYYNRQSSSTVNLLAVDLTNFAIVDEDSEYNPSYLESAIKCAKQNEPQDSIYCVGTNGQYSSFGVHFIHEGEDLIMNVLSNNSFVNIKGYVPKEVWVDKSMTALLLLRMPSWELDKSCSILENEPALLYIWKNGDDSPHCLIPLYSHGNYTQLTYEEMLEAEYKISFVSRGADTVVIVSIANLEEEPRGWQLGDMEIWIKNKTVEGKGLKIRLDGLAGPTEIELQELVIEKPHVMNNMIVAALTVLLVFILIIALVKYCWQGMQNDSSFLDTPHQVSQDFMDRLDSMPDPPQTRLFSISAFPGGRGSSKSIKTD